MQTNTSNLPRQEMVTDIEILVRNPQDPGLNRDTMNLAHSMCRPASMESDIHETILEAAELLQEHAPYAEGEIRRCYAEINQAVKECGTQGVVVRDLDGGAKLEVHVSRRLGFII